MKKENFNWDTHLYINEKKIYKYLSLILEKFNLVVARVFFQTMFYTVLF